MGSLFNRIQRLSVKDSLRRGRAWINENFFGWQIVCALCAIFLWVFFSFSDTPVLSGDVTAHRYWTSAAFQGLAALMALMASGIFIAVQLSTQFYGHRTIVVLYRNRLLMLATIVSALLLILLLLVQTVLRDGGPIPTLLTISLILSVCFLVCFPLLVFGVMRLLSPKGVLDFYLKAVDRKLMKDFASNTTININNPFIEIQNLITRLISGDPPLALYMWERLFEKLMATIQPDDYKNFMRHAGFSLATILQSAIEIRQDNVTESVVDRLRLLHQKINNEEFMSEWDFRDEGLPSKIKDAGISCAEKGYRSGAKEIMLNLGFMAESDLKFIMPDIQNANSRTWLIRDRGNGTRDLDNAAHKGARVFECFINAYINVPKEIAAIGTGSYGLLSGEVASNYHHLFFKIEERLKSGYEWSREWIYYTMASNVSDLMRSVAIEKDQDALFQNHMVHTLAEDFVRSRYFHPARLVNGAFCTLLLRQLELDHCPRYFWNAIVDVAMSALHGIDAGKEGLEVVRDSTKTLIELHRRIPESFQGERVDEERGKLIEELVLRFTQIREHKENALQNLDPQLAEALGRYPRQVRSFGG